MIRFFAITRAEIFCGNSGNYYLSIAGVKSMLCHLVSNFDFWGLFGRKMGGQGSGA